MHPRNRPSYPTAFLLVLLLSPTAIAEDWTTPDGKMSVTIPDSTRFTQIEVGQEALVGWKSDDGALTMIVAEMANPNGYLLVLQVVAEGFAKEFRKNTKNFMVLSSMTERRDGLDFLIMSGKGEKDDTTIYASQILTTTGNKTYKVLVMGNGVDTRVDQDAIALFKSFKPVGKVIERPPFLEGQAFDTQSEEEEKTISYQIGQVIGALFCIGMPIAIVCLIVFLASRSSRARNVEARRRRRRRMRRDDDLDEEEDEDRPRRRRRRQRDDEDDEQD